MLIIPEKPIIIVILAATLDFILGDPWHWPHPVRLMGYCINCYCQFWFTATQHIKYKVKNFCLRLAGIGLTIGLILGSGLISWFLIQLSYQVHPLMGTILEIILLASCFAGRSLRQAADDVLQPLKQKDLAQARQQLSLYVGRDTANLDESEIYRAILETVSENATDGVMAPLFYALIGIFVPFVGSVSLAIAYKAASTLDSMVGYRAEPYTNIGWCSAKVEDILTWLPCRLTVITIALISGRPLTVWRISQRDGVKDPSPNSGWSESAYAAALGVQMGGTNWYQGVPKVKPLLGDAKEPITTQHIDRALQLTRWSFLLWLALTTVIIVFNFSSF